jgi:uncharacterized membrane protein YqjE
MALPPKGDPRRPLHLAIRSTRLLGGLFVLFGICGMAPALYIMRGGPGPAAGLLLASGTLMYLVPGLLHIVFSIYLGHRKFWAVVGALVLASIQLLFVVFGAIGVVAMTISAAGPGQPFTTIMLLLIVFVAAALAQLIYHLSKSFESIKYPPYGIEVRGFEAIPMAHAAGMPPPAAPAGESDAAPPQG